MAIKWEQERANISRLYEISCRLASALGGKWLPTTKYGDAEYGGAYAEVEDHDTGARIGITTREGMLHFSGRFTERVENHTVFYRTSASPTCAIGVNINRNPDVWVAEIKRRLFPAYLPEWQRNLEAIAKYHAHNTTCLAVAGRLAAIIGAPEPQMVDHNADIRVYHSKRLPGAHFDLTVNEGTVRFDRLEVPELLASSILRILRDNCGVVPGCKIGPDGVLIEEE